MGRRDAAPARMSLDAWNVGMHQGQETCLHLLYISLSHVAFSTSLASPYPTPCRTLEAPLSRCEKVESMTIVISTLETSRFTRSVELDTNPEPGAGFPQPAGFTKSWDGEKFKKTRLHRKVQGIECFIPIRGRGPTDWVQVPAPAARIFFDSWE